MINACLDNKISFQFFIIPTELSDKDEKFEYRRMVIDESGDGEFVEKTKNKELKARKRREIGEPWDASFDGPKKMASRAAPVEQVSKRNVVPEHQSDTEDDPSRLGDDSGDNEQPEELTENAADPVSLGENRVSTDSSNTEEASSQEDSDESGGSGFEDMSSESGQSDESDESLESGMSGSDESEDSGDEADEEDAQESSML